MTTTSVGFIDVISFTKIGFFFYVSFWVEAVRCDQNSIELLAISLDVVKSSKSIFNFQREAEIKFKMFSVQYSSIVVSMIEFFRFSWHFSEKRDRSVKRYTIVYWRICISGFFIRIYLSLSLHHYVFCVGADVVRFFLSLFFYLSITSHLSVP